MRPHAITAFMVVALTTQGNIVAALPYPNPSNGGSDRLGGRTSVSTLDQREPMHQNNDVALESRDFELSRRAPIPPPPESYDALAKWIEDTGVVAAAAAFGGYIIKKGFMAFTTEAMRHKWAESIAKTLNLAHARAQPYTASEIELDTQHVVEIVSDVVHHVPGA